jgi:hypothetical protein
MKDLFDQKNKTNDEEYQKERMKTHEWYNDFVQTF